MPERPKRKRDYVILAAAVLGLGTPACDLGAIGDKTSTTSTGTAASGKGKPGSTPAPPKPVARPPAGRMGAH